MQNKIDCTRWVLLSSVRTHRNPASTFRDETYGKVDGDIDYLHICRRRY